MKPVILQHLIKHLKKSKPDKALHNDPTPTPNTGTASTVFVLLLALIILLLALK